MDTQDNSRAGARRSSRVVTSADRARFWAGLNRYLEAEAEHEYHEEQEADREHESGSDEAPDDQQPRA